MRAEQCEHVNEGQVSTNEQEQEEHDRGPGTNKGQDSTTEGWGNTNTQ